MRAYLRDVREGAKIVFFVWRPESREFWRAYRHYYTVTVPERVNAWAAKRKSGE